MYRFFVEKRNNNKFELTKEIINHLKAIRLKKDERFYCIYDQKYFICRLDNNEAIIEEETNINNENPNEIVLFVAIINIKRFEWLVQKATELGVKKIYPLITKNTNIKYIDIFRKKIDRLREISKNASEQSFRNILVEINEPISFNEAMKIDCKNKYIAHEKEKDSLKKDYLFEGHSIFFVGPEGGFDELEIKQAVNNNFKIVSLGKRILRSETAAIFLLSRIKE